MRPDEVPQRAAQGHMPSLPAEDAALSNDKGRPPRAYDAPLAAEYIIADLRTLLRLDDMRSSDYSVRIDGQVAEKAVADLARRIRDLGKRPERVAEAPTCGWRRGMKRSSMEALTAVCAALGPIPPRPRIIVGVPGIDENTWCDAPDNLYLVGEVAWRKLRTFIETADATDEHLPAAKAMLVGVPVEQYDAQNPRHAEIALRVLLAERSDATPETQSSRRPSSERGSENG